MSLLEGDVSSWMVYEGIDVTEAAVTAIERMYISDLSILLLGK